MVRAQCPGLGSLFSRRAGANDTVLVEVILGIHPATRKNIHATGKRRLGSTPQHENFEALCGRLAHARSLAGAHQDNGGGRFYRLGFYRFLCHDNVSLSSEDRESIVQATKDQ